jgi:hypothetical protein
MHHAAHIVQASVNEQRLFEHVKSMFTTTVTFVAELMQNARRAGSESVSFVYNEADDQLEVFDTGCGVADFRALISIAESAWSQEVMDEDRPFGMGFMSVCFAAKNGIEVASRGSEILFTGEDVIARRPIALRTSDFIGGTRVRLKGLSPGWNNTQKAILRFAKGFPIPVILDGKPVSRDDAKENLVGEVTSVGFIHVPAVHRQELREALRDRGGRHRILRTDSMFKAHSPWVYLQGLPCGSAPSSSHHPIVHLDNGRFEVRMPDRDTLIDQEKALKEVASEVRGIWRRFLVAERQSLGDAEFAEAYWDVAHATGAEDLLNEIDLIPARALMTISSYPVLQRWGESYFSGIEKAVTRNEVESGQVTLYRDVDDDESKDAFLRLVWALKAGATFVDALPEGHWASAHLTHLDDPEVELLKGASVGTAQFSGYWSDGTIHVLRSMQIRLGRQIVDVDVPVVVRPEEYAHENLDFYVPIAATSPSQVIDQASRYVDENDDYKDGDNDRDGDEFHVQFSIAKGETPDVTLQRIISTAPGYPTLRNQAYTVRIGADGKVSVEILR